MTSFTPTEDQQLLIETIRRYAINDVRPVAHEHDESSSPPLDVVETGWQIGLVASAIPEELGGFGEMSAITGVLAAEELAYGDLPVALHVMAPALFAYPVILFGTAEQRESLLPMFLEESLPPVSAALLEPGISFDAHAMQITASAADDGVTLNGVKAYVPLADSAEKLLVYARSADSDAVEAYIVPADTPGVSVEQREALMGLRALPMFRVKFDDVRVPAEARLGGVVGINYQTIADRMNVALAGLAVGVARASFEYARDYAKERVQFGRPVAQNQSIAFMLGEMAIEIDAARLMAWEAAWKIDQGQAATREAYLARQHANQMVLTVTDGGVQTLGGYGFIREYPAERWLRNGRGFPTFDGLAIV
ncbi:MAG: acyl-CoA dehydrogenase family protein [Phototrophicaceae bacterium]